MTPRVAGIFGTDGRRSAAEAIRALGLSWVTQLRHQSPHAMNVLLLATHYTFFFGAAATSHWRRGARSGWLIIVLRLLCVPIFGSLTLHLLDFREKAVCGDTGTGYLIYSLLTLGLLPLITHACAAVSGDFAAKAFRFLRDRKARRAEIPAPTSVS